MSTQELARIARLTVQHYDQRAADYWEGTRAHDVSQNLAALLQAIAAPPPWVILDFGCGPGRDLKTIGELGHVAVGLDGAARLVAMARDHGGCEVWQQDFLRLALPAERFDGVFANAALFHVPGQELPRVLGELWATLKPDGVLFTSNPPASPRSATTTARPACRAISNPGWPASGARRRAAREPRRAPIHTPLACPAWRVALPRDLS